MFKFNTSHIFTGYIKQLLASFNLPNYRIYTNENQQYFKEHGKELYIIESESSPIIPGVTPTHVRTVPYIKNDKVQKYVAGNWQSLDKTYYYNKKDINNTNTLEIRNNNYDRYTHEYLGDFLRFVRDYNNIDLMPLYNCFSNTLVDKLTLTGKVMNGQTLNSFTFDSSDTNYKIYMLPVKMFKNYTVAVDCDSDIELCCGLYDTYQDTRQQFDTLPSDTYVKITRPIFSKPILFTGLTEINKTLEIALAQNEQALKLFIKIPVKTKTSITVLEGNYIGWNDVVMKMNKLNKTAFPNHSVINFEIDSMHPDFDDRNSRLITALQLLMFNTGESYPFADRLIEYLTGAVITDQDPLSDNVKRIQKIISENYSNVDPNAIEIDGAWSNRIQHILYDYMYDFENNDIPTPAAVCHDILGFGDKDVEQHYKSKEREKILNTLKDVDLYKDIYKADKKKIN